MNQLKLKVTAGINSCTVNKTLQLLYNIQYMIMNELIKNMSYGYIFKTTFMTGFIGVN